MHQDLCAENETQDQAGPAQRAGPTVPSLLLSAAAPAALHCAVKQVRTLLYHSIDSASCTVLYPPVVMGCLVSSQIYSHHDGVLVLPGWSGHLLLLAGPRVSAAQHLSVHQTQDQGGPSKVYSAF